MESSLKSFVVRYKYECIVGFAMFLAATLLFTFSALRFPNDDQFILYRYIDNIVEGKGFVYNVGERVLGSTTPLFTLICAAVKYVFRGIPTPDVIAYVNIVLITAASVFFYRVSRFFLSTKYALFTSAIFILSLARVGPEGMETPLFLLTTFAYLNALLNKKYYTSSVWLSLTILTRPDAGLIAVLTAIYWFFKVGWKKTLQLTAVCIAIALPWLVFSMVYFGSPVPQSLLTKLHVDDMIYQSDLQAFKVQLAHISRLYWGKIIDPEFIPAQVIFNLLPFLIFLAITLKKKFTSETWIVFLIPFLYFISYSISNPVMFPWYLSQMEPFWILLSFVGIAYIAEKLKPAYVVTLFLMFVLAGPALGWWRTTTTDYAGSKIPLFKSAEYLRDHVQPGEKVGISNIGIVGYISQAYILDFIGLVNSDSVNYYPIVNGCIDASQQYVIPPKLIMDKQPEWIAAGDAEFDRCFIHDPWFTSRYSPVYSVGTARVWKLQK
jgi:hypothetical protein